MNATFLTTLDDQPIDQYHAHLIAYRAANFWYQRNFFQIKARAEGGDVLFQEVMNAEQRPMQGNDTNQRDFAMQCAVLCNAYGDVMMPVEEVALVRNLER